MWNILSSPFGTSSFSLPFGRAMKARKIPIESIYRGGCAWFERFEDKGSLEEDGLEDPFFIVILYFVMGLSPYGFIFLYLFLYV